MCADNTNSFPLINARQINCRRRDISTRNATHWRNVHKSFLTEPNVSTLKNICNTLELSVTTISKK